MPLLESVHELGDLLEEKDSFSIAGKRVASKIASNDLTLQNCFEFLSCLKDVVTGTNCTTQAELGLEKNVASHSLTNISVDVALVPDAVAQNKKSKHKNNN